MGAMSLTTALDIVFAAAVAVAVFALAGAATRRVGGRALTGLAALELAGAGATWIVFALHTPHDRELAVAAGGITGCTLAVAAARLVRRTLARVEAIDAQLDEAQTQLRSLVAREVADRAEELERVLARARADSVSLLVEEERRIAEERRRDFVERERDAAATLTEALTATQAQVEQRLAAWTQDLDRIADTTRTHIAELAERQKQLISSVELRLAADADRLSAESEELRASMLRLRSELDRAQEEALASARAELETHAAERRRALHELDDRLRRRERELLERLEREEIEAAQRIGSTIEDVQRRQIEQMQRIVERTTATYSEEAAQQFATLVKSSREDAARRLSRELDRAVEVFAREAEAVLAERLAHVGDAGAQRLERRLAEATAALERQRDERLGVFDTHIAALEADIRRRIEELGADAEAERAVLEARVQELLRRVESATVLRSS